MPPRISYNRTHLLFIAVVSFCLFFRLGVTPIYILDEARNAQCAWEMKERHDYVMPVFNNELRSDKPPLHYYFMITAYLLFGKTAFAARFFSAFAGMLTLLGLYFFTRRYAGEKQAFFTVCLLSLSLHFLFEFRLAVPDPFFILFQLLTFLCLYDYSQKFRPVSIYAAGVFAALSALTKGPVALVLPSLVFVLYLLSYRQLKKVLSIHVLASIIVCLLIAMPWYYWVDRETQGVFTRSFFLNKNINRFSTPMEGHVNYPGLALLMCLVGMLPGSLLLFSGKAAYSALWQNHYTRFAILVCGATLLLYSFSRTILPHYTMICYPFVAILLAALLQHTKLRRGYFLGLFIFYSVLAVAGFIFLWNEKTLEQGTAWWVLVFCLPVLLFLIMAIKPARASFYPVLLTGMVLFNVLILGFAYPFVYRQNPVTMHRSLFTSQTTAGSFGKYNPAINFYMAKPVQILNDSMAIIQFLGQHKDGLLVGREKDLFKLNGLPVKVIARQRDLFELPTTVLLVRSDSLFQSTSSE